MLRPLLPTAAITWGVTVSVGAQRRWGQVCAVIGLGLAGAAVAAVFGFATLDPDKARLIENQYQAGQRESAAELKTAARPAGTGGIESASEGVTR